MAWLLTIAGLLLIVLALSDTFETIILPRTVSRPFRLDRMLLRSFWVIWKAIAGLVKNPSRRENWLSGFGPLALVWLIIVWAGLMVLGFAMLQEGLHVPLNAPEAKPSFGTYLYVSAVTLFTLGFGDVTALNSVGRTLSVIEAGFGFGFLAAVISYLPVLYQGFSKRESTILLLDARAGSPPVGSELLARHAGDLESLRGLLLEFERWSAQMLESYLSYPLLSYYRSQHERQTWLGAAAAVLDCCALISLPASSGSGGMKGLRTQANLTYAMTRHLIVDLAFILPAPPGECPEPRLSGKELDLIYERFRSVGLEIELDEGARQRLDQLREDYEPYLGGVANYLAMDLPKWAAHPDEVDNWRTTAWDQERHF